MKKAAIALLAAALLAIPTAGCRRDESPIGTPAFSSSVPTEDAEGTAFPATFREAAERDDFVVHGNDGRLLNGQLWEDFLNAASRGEEASVTVVLATMEGDPIYQVLAYRDNRYHLNVDYTHDKWGQVLAEQAHEEVFSCLECLEYDGAVYYILTNEPFGSDEAFADYQSDRGEGPERYFTIVLELWRQDPS